MDKPNVSVIVPVYNVEKYLQRCVDSIKSQSLRNIEIILVDDASPDSCPYMCDMFAKQDSRIKVIHKKNEGLGFARNSGLEVAKGEYVYFVDSDDYLCQGSLELLYRTAHKEKLDICFGGIVSEDDDGRQERKVPAYAGSKFYQPEIRQIVLAGMLGSDPGKKTDANLRMSVWQGVYRRQWIEDNNLRFSSEREFISEDIVFHLNALPKAFSMMYVNDCVYCHIVDNPNSLTHKYNPDRYAKDVILYLEEVRLIEKLPEHDKMKVRAQRMLLANTRVCLKHILSKSKSEGKQFALDEIDRILNDPVLQDVLKQYPYWKNPWKQAIMSFLLKHNKRRMIYIVTGLFNSRS